MRIVVLTCLTHFICWCHLAWLERDRCSPAVRCVVCMSLSCLLECGGFIRAELSLHWILIYYCKSHLFRKWHLAPSRFNDIIHEGMFFSHSHFLLCPLEHSNTDHHWFQPPDFIWTFDTALYRSFLSRWSICASFVVFRTEPPTFPSSSFKLRAIESHWSLAVYNGVSTWQNHLKS